MMTILIWMFSLFCSILMILVFVRKCKIGLHYGMVSVLTVGLLVSLVFTGIHKIVQPLGWKEVVFLESVSIVFCLFVFIIFRFYRDPDRDPPAKRNVLVSPADGTIRYVHRIKSGEALFSKKAKQRFSVKELTGTDILKDGVFLVGIEMNIMDVHVNRAPVAGKICLQKHIPGAFYSLRLMKSIQENERVTTVIDTGSYLVGVIQIASRTVRRIQSYHKEGDRVKLGQRIGMIKFGSQVDVVIPDLNNLRITVEPDMEVRAGESVIAEFG